ncbi:cytochrome c oxidase subunit II [Roseivivax isoporae]|uniref:Cytochrome B561 n=1 Tax=Roseivivax isoporae LMG 25204 TaxID=1449351 RepID=X7FE89_9RHOB|nr:cytochrome c oxidase subunit II [Roseivivax isoporae]ETX30396.1 cytochrome B561 [Roseivivax isoporae LMG 25204]
MAGSRRRAGRDPLNVGRVLPAVLIAILLGGCSGVQSVLDPAGRDAEVLARLFWWMLGGAVILWVLMNGLLVYVSRIDTRPLSARAAEWLIIGGGIVFPTVVLAGLLSFALSEMPEQRAPGSGLTVSVTGESWWWRVEYLPDGAETPVVSANEIRLPVGRRSEITLNAHRVIHSFWIPALGGKTDMIPGRETRMSLEPTRAGEFRGQCAEFCGESHALMALGAVVMDEDAFAAWLEKEAAPAVPPESDAARRGQAVFNAEGCGACHAVRGTAASGRVGPDLTHVGGRVSLAAGILPMTAEALMRWIRDPEAIKPGAMMPGYDHLSDDDLSALAAYLEGLT